MGVIEIVCVSIEPTCARWRVAFADGSFVIIRRPAIETIFTVADKISRIEPCNSQTVATLNMES